MNASQLERLVKGLCSLPAETPWVEFKESNADPQMIGELVSALSNAAALNGRETAWAVWGIRDGSHAIVGTGFVPSAARRGGQDLESWLVQMLSPRLHVKFHCGMVDEKEVVALEIPAARSQPTAFSGRRWIRVGPTSRALRDVPQMEQELWRRFDDTPFERRVGLQDRSEQQVLELLDCPSYWQLLRLPPPSRATDVLARFESEGFVRGNDAGHWDVTNLGAILFARNLADFPTVARKAVRLIFYKGRGRTATDHEREERKGYAVGFEGLMKFLNDRLPRSEIVGAALRRDAPAYPDPALRELVANALIHQDFEISGSGPMVEVFEGRVETSNPGVPLVDIRRLLDHPPRSRNETLARFMRRVGVCEERGGGVDRVVAESERHQLPPPRWETSGDSSRAVLFARRSFREMNRADRVHACYLHACLKHVMQEEMTNTSLRERFGLDERNSAMASRVIRDALDEGAIKPADPRQGRRHARYRPAWA